MVTDNGKFPSMLTTVNVKLDGQMTLILNPDVMLSSIVVTPYYQDYEER